MNQSTFDNLTPRKDWSFKEYKRVDTGKLTHNYHKYPAKFIPQLVERLLDIYGPKNQSNFHVNDPFMGSGTTAVVSLTRDLKFSGTDVDHLACLLTKVKTTPIEPEKLEKELQKFLVHMSCNTMIKLKKLSLDDSFCSMAGIDPDVLPNIQFWFSEVIIQIIGKMLFYIRKIKDIEVQDFFKVAFSSILKECSYWSLKSNKPLRNLDKKVSCPLLCFQKSIELMIRKNKELYNFIIENKIPYKDLITLNCGDAREQIAQDSNVDIIITSSPYVTSYEYMELNQLSYWWLNFEGIDNLKSYKIKYIGTSLKKNLAFVLPGNLDTKICTQLQHKDTALSVKVAQYYYEMFESLKESYRILKPGGVCCYVIGNTELRGVKILNAEVFAEYMKKIGFKIEDVVKREVSGKFLPQTRDKITGKFSSVVNASSMTYPTEYILVAKK